MESSQYLAKAREIISAVRKRPLSGEVRRECAIDLAALMLQEARRIQTSEEHRMHAQLAKMMDDPKGKAFTTTLTDQCFRSNDATRIATQIKYLITQFGIPKYLSYFRQLQLLAFKFLGTWLPSLFVPLAKKMLRDETSKMIIPGERNQLASHMEERRREGVRINLNKLGEAIIGEEEAKKRIQIYLNDLAKPEVEYISVKISTLYSQIKLVAWEATLHILEERLKEIYRAAMQHTFVGSNGNRLSKFVNLDMEEYRDMDLTVELFRRVLDDPEFYQFSAGIVLQSYLPDAYLIQQELTAWAMQRVAKGGAPIKIRIVKGANLAMEKVEASMRGWPQSPYLTKADVDANYKRMLLYACLPEHCNAVRIGVGSHNLFDIAYALLLSSECGVEDKVEFEMLEGMADHIRRVVQQLSGGMLLYCPAAKEREFSTAVAYFVRRLDENAAPENFLRHIFDLIPDTQEWHKQVNRFSLACHSTSSVGKSPRRTQNRFQEPAKQQNDAPFINEPDTDWSLSQNRKWIQSVVNAWKQKELEDVPLVIGGSEIFPNHHYGIGRDPSCPGVELYRYALADNSEIDLVLKTAETAHLKWKKIDLTERMHLLEKLSQLVRVNRGELIGAMIADAGKTVVQADSEVSEAIDFIEYYRTEMKALAQMKDIRWHPRGIVVVAPPWNFPCSIPLGGIVGGLVTGNCVIFKPALETAYVGWRLAKLCWEAGMGKDVLQFILCEDKSVGSQLIKDPRVSTVVLTGSTETAKMMLRLRPGLHLVAETGGKNSMIITGMSDRELAIKDLVNSAFGHAGQKCSACSLAICETEVYEDPFFRKTLCDAARSLKVGSAWELSTSLNPLIREASEKLKRGLTTLESGEEWLLEPKQDPENPNLWHPGIKFGVKPGSFMHQNELFGPLLGVMKADNMKEALTLANGTPYGLTAGIHTLDDREQKYWIDHIEAGNCYVNRGITGAIVRRQPFGGCKESSFGSGAKAGGPNYLMQLMWPEQLALPEEQEMITGAVKALADNLEKIHSSPEKMFLWYASLGSYVYYFKNYFSKRHDPDLILGQDNILKYVPHPKIQLRVNTIDDLGDVMRVIAASMICNTPLEVSGDEEKLRPVLGCRDWLKLTNHILLVEESETEFIERIRKNPPARVRLITHPSLILTQVLGDLSCSVVVSPPVANGRIELFHYLREVLVSVDYHRYGNLGLRENVNLVET